MNGYIKLYRKLLDWEWFKDSNTVHVFIYLLLRASWKDERWQGIDIKEGQLVTTFLSISEATGVTRQCVRTAIKRLISTNEITIESTNKYSLVTIVKWALYQIEDTQLTNTLTNDLTNDQQTTNKQLTTYKEDNKERTKEIVSVERRRQAALKRSAKAPDVYSNEFEMFWNMYPKKVGKGATYAEWVKRLKDGEFVESILEATRNYISYCEKTMSDLKYMKNPANFIGSDRLYCDYIEKIPDVVAGTVQPKKQSRYVDQE